MKHKALLFSCGLLLLTSCEEKLPEVEEGNKITYTDNGYEIPFSYGKMESYLYENDLERDLITYFKTRGMHYSETETYALEYKGELKGRNFRVSFTYDESVDSLPFSIVSQWYKDDKSQLPDAYFYFSAHFDILSFKDIHFTSYYYYDYEKEDSKEFISCYVPVIYEDIQFGNSPLYQSVSFHLGQGTTMPTRAVKEEKEIGASGFECIRVATTFVQTTLSNIKNSYRLW